MGEEEGKEWQIPKKGKYSAPCPSSSSSPPSPELSVSFSSIHTMSGITMQSTAESEILKIIQGYFHLSHLTP